MISCECPTNVDTNRSNTPSSFANVDTYNHTNSRITVLNNNVEIETLENGKNGVVKYFSGNPSISLLINDVIELRRSTQLIENNNYTMLIYDKGQRKEIIVSSDQDFNEQEIFIRVFNLSSTGLNFNNYVVTEGETSGLLWIDSDIYINDVLSIKVSELQAGNIHNFIVEDSSFTYFN